MLGGFVISLDRVYKSFESPVLRGVTLTARGGRILGLVGPPGAGKTVLLRAIAGLLDVDAGKIRILGREMVQSSDKTRRNLQASIGMLFLAATLYGVGKTFFWPTTLGTVSELYPRGGALLLNAISGVGMISVGTIGLPANGTLQDADFRRAVAAAAPDVFERVSAEKEGLLSKYKYIDKQKFAAAGLTDAERQQLTALESQTKQHALAKIAVLPVIMCVCYLSLIAYFQARGGYKAEVLTGHAAEDEKFTGGTLAPGEG